MINKKLPEGSKITTECINGWLQKFKQRKSFKQFKAHGESGGADMDQASAGIPHLQDILKAFQPQDI
ncbi:hypothetical protein ACQY0O_006635 [Thecaphora frezii]